MYVCFYLCEFIYTTSVPVQVKEGTGAPGSGDLDGYESHDTDAGNHTWVLCKNHEHSQPLGYHRSSPIIYFYIAYLYSKIRELNLVHFKTHCLLNAN